MFVQVINWKALAAKKVKAPLDVAVGGPTDTAHFDPRFTSEPLPDLLRPLPPPPPRRVAAAAAAAAAAATAAAAAAPAWPVAAPSGSGDGTALLSSPTASLFSGVCVRPTGWHILLWVHSVHDDKHVFLFDAI